MEPYRTAASREESFPRSKEEGEVAVWVLGLVVWTASVIRACGAIVCHEDLGAEPTLAIAVVFLLPWLFLRAFRPNCHVASKHR